MLWLEVCVGKARIPSHSPLVTSLGNPSALVGAPAGYGQSIALPQPSQATHFHNTDTQPLVCKFYGALNNILRVTGPNRNEMVTVHLVKTYCLPSLLYGYM